MDSRHLIILVGNIGTGKTTLVKKYQKKGYVVIARDQLRYTIGNGEYIFNHNYEPIIWDSELYMFERFIELGVDVIIDEVGLNKKMRNRYISKAKYYNYFITVIVFPKLTMKESVDRRLNNPHGQPDRNLWERVWKNFDEIYEEPTKDEGIDEIIRLKREDVI